MNQDVIFSEDGVSVNFSHLRVSNKNYSIKSLLYIRVASTNIWRGLAIISILFGFILMVDEGPLFVIGGVLFFAGVLAWISCKPIYSLWITTSEGETVAFSTSNKMLMEKTMSALYSAMADNKWHPDNSDSHPDLSLPSS